MIAGQAMLGPITTTEIREAPRLHIRAFPNFFLSKPGEAFLVQFYRGSPDDPPAVTVFARGREGGAIAAAVGTTEAARLFSTLLRRRWVWFVLASLRAILRHPSAAPRLIRTTRSPTEVAAEPLVALLSSICLEPSHQSSGVGGQLLEASPVKGADRGLHVRCSSWAPSATTRSKGFYNAYDWRIAGSSYTTGGRKMTHYEKWLVR